MKTKRDENEKRLVHFNTEPASFTALTISAIYLVWIPIQYTRTVPVMPP
ncbi:hypothetical protein [Bacteroides nordii]|nr:hypothetical protein [Bacteroides nordii]